MAEKTVTKIHGQPSIRDITQLKRELTKISASVSTGLGGGKHGHVGIVIPKDKYIKVSEGGAEFDIPTHPGHYPDTVSSVAATRDKQFAKHKALIAEYEVCTGVVNAMKEKIVEAVDEEWLEEINDKILGFQNVPVTQMFEHLVERAGELDYIDLQEMKQERDAPWNTNEHIVTYFTKVERAVKRMKDKIKMDEKELLSNALYTIKESGEMEHALRTWDKKDEADKTWKECKSYFSKEYANRRKHSSIEAKQTPFGRANQAKEEPQEDNELELAAVTHEIVQQLRAQDSNHLKEIVQQQKSMLEANQKMMTQLMQAVMNTKNTQPLTQPSNGNAQPSSGSEKRTRWEEWQTEKKGDSVQHNGKTWWWCPQHHEGKGLYVRHKPENHDKWLASKTGGPRFCEQE